jgi:histidine ammonia-lyase
MDGGDAMDAAGIARVALGAKEGVALINGTAISAAIGALAWHDAYLTLAASEVVLAMSLEALRGFRDAYLPHLHAVDEHRIAVLDRSGRREIHAHLIHGAQGSRPFAEKNDHRTQSCKRRQYEDAHYNIFSKFHHTSILPENQKIKGYPIFPVYPNRPLRR